MPAEHAMGTLAAKALLSKHFVHLPVVVLLAFSIWAAWRGVDFGQHWDEHIIVLSLQRSLRTGLFLPNRYNYPSIPFYLPYLTLIPDALLAWFRGEGLAAAKEALIAVAGSHSFLLNVRRLFAVVTLLSIVWVYVAVYAWRRIWWEALVAASILGLSFELDYHARWVAPDGPMMQFSALTVALLVVARRPGAGTGLLTAAAAAAGLATGSKYPGGIMLVPVLLAPFLSEGARHRKLRAVGTAVKLGLVFALAFLISTPATLIEPYEFWAQLAAVKQVYEQEGHGGYTIVAGLPHLAKLTSYLSLVALSPFPFFAGALFCAALAGGAHLAWRHRGMAALLLLAPALYLAYFAQARVMIVRNLLVIFPFLAILAAYGLSLFAGWVTGLVSRTALPRHATLVGLGSILALPAVFGAGWLVHAQASIRNRHAVDPIAVLQQELAQRSNDHFGVSPEVRRQLTERGGLPRPNVVDDPAPEDWVAMFPREIPNWMWRLPSNERGLYALLPTGPLDVNWDYYASWLDENRLIFMRARLAKQLNLRMMP